MAGEGALCVPEVEVTALLVQVPTLYTPALWTELMYLQALVVHQAKPGSAVPIINQLTVLEAVVVVGVVGVVLPATIRLLVESALVRVLYACMALIAALVAWNAAPEL
ncbi:MAG: hypothetical protein A3A58_00535 [Candidatus Blackburnbacteria bacterium RIFCSPLOWO2_01_FULL_41_27]|uniref:Uncharacterized protein n=1 Tax=Candidatus Blackburnbacteria bacterium RIFCSPLOWO2_01_FULL_41_27 TaxID=1797520 RepID=A0A1G1VI52_9BACT|nr:MAG: hypothetical protein A3A58_00535 [Candidatus Blackburnbacteria bacterium RIFCSPLOWO2_01_FULL_41_27]